VRRYVGALAAGDKDAIGDSWAEDGTCWYGGDLPISGTWRGRDQVIDGFLARLSKRQRSVNRQHAKIRALGERAVTTLATLSASRGSVSRWRRGA
jgi:ketosteroid isomerase-like protein